MQDAQTSPTRKIRPALPLRQELTIPFLVLLLLCSAATGWLSLHNGSLAVDDVAAQLRVEVLQRVTDNLTAYLEMPHRINVFNAQAIRTGVLNVSDKRNRERFFHNVLQTNPGIAYSFFGTPEGEFYGGRRLPDGRIEIVRAGQETGGDSHNFAASPLGDALERTNVYPKFDPRTRPWYKAGAEAEHGVWTQPYRHFVFKDMTLTASLPVRDPGDNRLLGVLGVDYVLSRVHTFLSEIKVGKTGQVFLLDRSGHLIASSRKPEHGYMIERDKNYRVVMAVDSGLEDIAGAVRRLAARPDGLKGVTGEVVSEYIAAGQDMLLQAAPFADPHGIDWLVVVVVPRDDFMEHINRNTKQTVLAILVALGCTLLAGSLLAGRIARPIENLSVAADGFNAGQTTFPPANRGSKEIRHLTQAFRRMADQIAETMRELRRKNVTIEEQNRTLELRVARRTSELNDMHSRLRAIFDAIPGFIHVIDKNYRIVDVGDTMLERIGQARDEVVGRPCHEVFHGLNSVCGHCHLSHLSAAHSIHIRPSTPEEEARLGLAFMVYSSPVFDKDGNIWGYIECLMDISELRRVERELVAAKDAAEEANRAKSDFLAKMSHDIRTPLNSIIGLTSITLESPLRTDQRDYLETVLEAGRNLLDLVNDLLDYAKFEVKKPELASEHFALPRLVAATARTFRLQARKKGLDLSVRIARNCPRHCQGDPARLRQIVINLVSNALKFTDHGGVFVAVDLIPGPGLPPDPEQTASGEQANWIRFTVRDTGIGIAPDVQAAIFDPFTQADKSISPRYGGTGLGLAICKQLVEQMGGTICLDSSPGQGSTFTFEIPLRPGNPELVGEHAAPIVPLEELRRKNRPLRLILAEDNHMNIKLARVLLQRLGHDLRVVGNGREAIDALRADLADAVLMDMEMPVMDGLEAARRIRAGEAGEGVRNVPIVAMTAHALPEFRDKCLEAGMNGFITKPLDFAVLAATLGGIGADLPPDRPVAGMAGEHHATENVVNTATALGLLENDTDLYHEMCQIFLNELPERKSGLTQALSQGDLRELGRLAHIIKGGASAIGAERVQALADEVESCILDSGGRSCGELTSQLVQELDAARDVLEDIVRS